MSDEQPPSDECPCGGFIAWIDEGDSWGGSCYGQCGDYPRVPKANLPAAGAPKGWQWGYLPCGCRNDGHGRHVRG